MLKEALKEWIMNHPADQMNDDYMYSGGKMYSLKQILKEIEDETNFGKGIEKKIIKLAIDLLVRGKKKLDE
jgi:hypothetical protein